MRVLAITTDASLEVALSSLPGGWEIVSAKDPDGALQAACHTDIALVALGTTERGLAAVEALHRLGVGLPSLVVGEAAGGDDALAPVLVRPFSLAELTDAMRRAATFRPATPPPLPADVPPLEPPAAPPAIPEPLGYEPEPLAFEPEPLPVAYEPEPLPPEAPPEPEPQPLPPEPEPLPLPPEPASAQDRLGALLLAGSPKPADHRPPDLADWALSLLHEIGQSPAEPPPAAAPPADEPRPRVRPAGVAPTEATAARIVRHAAATPSGGDWLADRTSERTGLHRLRRRRRVTIPAGGTRAAMLRRVRSALDGARDLAALIEEIPALTRPDSMARALVREAVELVGAQSAVLYAADGAGPYTVVASIGLTPAEQSSTVPRDQPLLSDVANRLEAVLVAPVDLVRGLVAGVAGTACDALMIAPLEVDNVCHGLLIAGRDSFADSDLERLWLLAEEAAPGFVAARLIERLGGGRASLTAGV